MHLVGYFHSYVSNYISFRYIYSIPSYAQHNLQFFIVDCDTHDCVVNKYIY
jgi:hypothetical protein